MSLDGYIAGPNGEYDWIPMDPDMDFGSMMSQFDTFLMGRRTYEAFSATVGTPTIDVWVFSTTLRQEDHPAVTIVNDNIVQRIAELKSGEGRDIALYGGGSLFRSLLELGCVDTVEVAVVPVMIGSGVPLLPAAFSPHALQLTKHTLYPKTGTLHLEYDVVTPQA